MNVMNPARTRTQTEPETVRLRGLGPPPGRPAAEPVHLPPLSSFGTGARGPDAGGPDRVITGRTASRAAEGSDLVR